MSTATLILDHWQIRFHETMAALLRAQEAVERQFNLWGVLNGLWRCSSDMKSLNEALKALSELPDGYITDDFIRSHIPQVRKLLMSTEELIDIGKRKGLANRSLTASVLESIRARGEYVADYLDALEMSIDHDVSNAINEGRQQIERGDYEKMESLF